MTENVTEAAKDENTPVEEAVEEEVLEEVEKPGIGIADVLEESEWATTDQNKLFYQASPTLFNVIQHHMANAMDQPKPSGIRETLAHNKAQKEFTKNLHSDLGSSTRFGGIAKEGMDAIKSDVAAWKAAKASGDTDAEKAALASVQLQFQQLGDKLKFDGKLSENMLAPSTQAHVAMRQEAGQEIRDGLSDILKKNPDIAGTDMEKALAEGAKKNLDSLKEQIDSILDAAKDLAANVAKMFGIGNGAKSQEANAGPSQG